MRRDIFICSIGVLAGFALAMLIFWQPKPSAPPTEIPAPQMAADMPAELSPSPLADAGRIGVPLAVEPEAVPTTPTDWLHDALTTLPETPEGSRDKLVAELVAKLRAQGPAGIQAVRDFFKTGDDVTLRRGWGMANGRITIAPSLRIALLDALSDWPGALEVNREIARTTSRPFEAAIAIRNFEKAAPGVYRAEAIRTMQELANQPENGEYAMEGANYIIETIRYFNAPELIPAAEKIVASQPPAAFALISALAEMPEAVGDPAIQRVFADAKVSQQLAANPYVLHSFPFSRPQIATQVAQLFTGGMNAKQQDRFLSDFGASRSYAPKPDFFAQQNASARTITVAPATTAAAELQGRLDFLTRIEPAATTPVLKQRVDEAREELTKAINDPEESATSDATQTISIGDGIGDAVIKGRTIQDIQIRIEK